MSDINIEEIIVTVVDIFIKFINYYIIVIDDKYDV